MMLLPDILARYTDLLDIRQIAQARTFMAATMGEWLSASAVSLFGRDETNENFIELGSWPAGSSGYHVNIDESERGNTPLFRAFGQTKIHYSDRQTGNLWLKQLKQQFFPAADTDSLILLPAVYKDTPYPDLIFLATGFEQTAKEHILAIASQFAVFCATFNRMNTDFSRMKFQGKQLERSLQVASASLQKKKAMQTDLLSSRLVGLSRQMATLRQNILKYGPASLSVLIQGETGTGKELVAQSLHQTSRRSDNRFVPVNVAAIPENLIESELFGFVKGAFTGADKTRAGLLAEAHGGTLFLDEIGDLPLSLQAKLLRVLQEKKYRPLGSNHELSCDVRFIAATHKNMQQLVKNGLFREDLYYRLAEGTILLVPLRERTDDILELADYFLAQAGAHGASSFRLSPQAAEYLGRQGFPGNIRQLRSIIHNASLSADNNFVIHLDAVQDAYESAALTQNQPETPKAIAFSQGLQSGINAFEKMILQEAIAHDSGSRFEAAQKLHIPLRTFYNKLRKYGLENTANV